jgi:nucleoside-diphosphate-sugar epimerase
MIYLLGSNGKIGRNIAKFFMTKKISFQPVTKESDNNNLGFNQFINIAPFEKNVLIINTAILNNSDFNLLNNSFSNKTRMIYISSVSVYGNTILSNNISPINKYGYFKVREEKILTKNFNICIVRLANIFGGNPETSGVMGLINTGNLNYIEVDENNNELVRDYVYIDDLLNFIYNNLNFKKSKIVNISKGKGMTSSEFFKKNNLKKMNLKKMKYNKSKTIKVSIVDPSYIKFI